MRHIINFFFTGKTSQWTAFATVMMMVFSGLLWHVSDVANETNRETQRAMLSSSGPIIQKVNMPDGKTLKGFSVTYFWANGGTIPAKEGRAQFNLSLGATRPTTGLDFMSLPQSSTIPFVLGPKGAIQMAPVSISREEMDAVEQGKLHLFFWGWVIYRDGLLDTPRRLSEFCTDITNVTWSKPDHTDATVDIVTSSPPCETHNCYDEQCADYSALAK
jgi:hypothetical protein